MNLTDEQRADYADLLARPQFLRFCLRVIQLAGIYDATANGTDSRHLFNEGRRSLGLDLLRELDAAQPVQAPSGNPTLTLIQVHREEAQSPPQERNPNGKRTDPYSDLNSSE